MSVDKKVSIPTRSLAGMPVNYDTLQYVSEGAARHYQFVPINFENGVLEIGILDPENLEARDAIQLISSKSGLPYKLFVISQEDFEKVVENYKNLKAEVTKALGDFETSKGKVSQLTGKPLGVATTTGVEATDQNTIVEDAPVTKIVSNILNYAVDGNASDVHVEPIAEKVRVRFRVDGILFTSLFLPANVHEAVVARVKILTNMKLDEKRKPQDGRFSAKIGDRLIDFRVSTLPTAYGEKIVMRILDPSKGLKDIENVGLTDKNRETIKRALKRPYGMILITGPTGSGKTTTLAAMLNELDREGANVISLEDPVEYNVEGVNQSQVRPEIEYTFASGLRSILRQDPDIIMVGEIRDKETAQLAIQAALTGHLVLSTLHTNNAIGAIPRLIDMGVDPFLIAPTLILTIAQRLVRVLCPDGKDPAPADDTIRMIVEKEIADLPEEAKKALALPKEIYHAKRSPTCPSGTRGRIAAFEMIEMDKELEHMILTNPSEQDIQKFARSKGMYTMKEDAIQKAFAGLIPFEEVHTL